MQEKLIPLGMFIESVKSELLAYQTKHEGEPSLFELEEVEITASIITRWEAEAKVSVLAVGIGAGGKQEGSHSVRIKMRIPKHASSLPINIEPNREFVFDFDNLTIGNKKITPGGYKFKPVVTYQIAADDVEIPPKTELKTE